MWVVPLVSGNGQVPAVNLDTAQSLQVGRAGFGQDPDRLAVYAVFGPGERDRLPLVEIPIPSGGSESDGHEVAKSYINRIIDALNHSIIVLDFMAS